MSKPLIVLKFGGSSLATPQLIRSVAQRISELHSQGHPLIVVVSAMGKSTDELLRLAREVSEKPNRRELDMLLTTGERVSMALMSMALHDLNCPSISFTGSQAGVLTDASFTNAKIIELKPIRVAEALATQKVVVLAGFQGVDPISREITTLGRGGSDTTAVAMAAHFKAARCEILKDVDGVYSADPKIVESAVLFKKLPIDVLYEFCFWGAKVLNYRSVEWAREHRAHLHIGRSENFKLGTEIVLQSERPSARKLLGVNSHAYVAEISGLANDLQHGEKLLRELQDKLDLAPLQILRQNFSNGTYRSLITAGTSDHYALDSIIAELKSSSSLRLERGPIATVTKTYSDAKSETEIVERINLVETVRAYHKGVSHEEQR